MTQAEQVTFLWLEETSECSVKGRGNQSSDGPLRRETQRSHSVAGVRSYEGTLL